MKFCIQYSIRWLVLLILIQSVHQVNSAPTKGKCENCTNIQELTLALAILGTVSLLFITLCLCRCLPKFTQIMFSSAEQLNAVHRAQHTQRLSQILKRQQLRAQQLASQSQLTTGQQNDLLEKGLFSDPFLGAGVLGSILLTPSRLSDLQPSNLSTTNTNEDNKQQVNGGLSMLKDKSSNDLNEIKTTPISQSGKRLHPSTSFSVAAQAAAAATHMLHQQRNSTLRKQLAKRNLEQQKQSKLKDSSFSSSFDQSQDQSINKSPLTRFLKKSSAIRPVQLQHSVSLTSFAGVPKVQLNNSNLDVQLNNRLTNQLRLTSSSECKQPVKYTGVDKNIMTINQQPITFDFLYDVGRQMKPDQLTQFDYSNSDLEVANKQDHHYSKSIQNIEQQPITWLDHELLSSEDLNDDELPAPLPLDVLDDTGKKRKIDPQVEFTKSRSMPMLINQCDALYRPCYIEHDDHFIDLNDQLNDHVTCNQAPFHFRQACNQTNFNTSDTYGLSHENTQDDTFNAFQQDQRRFVNSSFGSNHRINLDHQQWPDAQLQQFLSAYNHYTQRTSVNRNHTRSMFDLY